MQYKEKESRNPPSSKMLEIRPVTRDIVDYGFVMENGLAKEVKNNSGLKVLGNGELNVALTVKAAKFSASAKAAIEAAQGTAETI